MKLSRESAFRFIWLISLVSFFSDMTYQGAHANAGPYLALLGASGTVVGIVAGAGEFVNYGLRLVSGYWTDRTRNYWWMAFPGYVLNLLAVPCLALAGHWPMAAAFLILERMGKGIRTPVRDTLLSHAADQVGRGWAFGLHEMFDQAGGMIGPILVAALLFWKKSYQLSFLSLAIPAALALTCLTATRFTFPHPEEWVENRKPMSTQNLPKSFWLLLAGVGCLAAGYADFALMAFHFAKHSILPFALIPLCYGLAMGLQGLSSLVLGRLFDRWNVQALLLASIPAMAFAPLAFLGDRWTALLGVALWAVGLGAQSSVMKALVAELVDPSHRGSAYGILNSAYGVFWFGGSAMMGWFYDRSLIGLVVFSLAAQLASIPILLFLRARPAN